MDQKAPAALPVVASSQLLGPDEAPQTAPQAGTAPRRRRHRCTDDPSRVSACHHTAPGHDQSIQRIWFERKLLACLEMYTCERTRFELRPFTWFTVIYQRAHRCGKRA